MNTRIKAAYKEFSDVVTFDTIHLTNIYDMLFAPFIEVNHHEQLTLFGYGLISNENTKILHDCLNLGLRVSLIVLHLQ